MKVLYSWLREFAPLTAAPDELAETLSNLGLAVEEMEHLGAGLDGVIVARVVETRPHPEADRVQLVDVDPGNGEVLQVVCGAFNMAAGDLVPLATVGTVMPAGLRIERRKLRGQWSNGMLCSPPELNLPGDPQSILILPSGHVPGTPLTEALGIERDVLYDLEVNANRPDAMSVAGVARDLAAHYRLPFTLLAPAVVDDPELSVAELATVEIEAPDLCGRFVARVLRGVTIGPSSPRVANRLTLLGMRPINAIVDASNYVMLELGRPSHPYDLALLPRGGIRVRRARDGETLVTLDGVTRTFTVDDLLICDGDDRAIGIAGVMGGADTEISDATTDILLEMAWFQPMAIARTGRRLGLRSEASARFERGCDPFDIELAAARFIELLGPAAGRVATGMVDARGTLPEATPVRLRTARVNAMLGTALSPDDVQSNLTPLGFDVTAVDGDHDVIVPSFRPDTATEIDLIEEVARAYGYERIGKGLPASAHTGGLTATQHERRRVRRALVGLGCAEAMPLPFLAPGDLERCGLDGDGISIVNPLVADESVLRTSLLPGLLKAVAYNESHRQERVRLFEIGHVFRRPNGSGPLPSLPDEREHVAAALAGEEAPAAVAVLDALLADVGVTGWELETVEVAGLHPTRAAAVRLGDASVGAVGEVDPSVLEAMEVAERVGWFELDLGRLLDRPPGEVAYESVSRYPSSDIDVAFEVAESTPAAAVERALREAGGSLLVRLELFDIYRGDRVAPGTRSLAYRLRLQAPDRTLTDDETAAVRTKCINAVESQLPAKLRG